MLVNVHAGGAGGCGAMQHSAIIGQGFSPLARRVAPIMAHYVAIAWGLNFWRAFLWSLSLSKGGLGQLFGFCFYR
jgi:hypothetical protein